MNMKKIENKLIFNIIDKSNLVQFGAKQFDILYQLFYI